MRMQIWNMKFSRTLITTLLVAIPLVSATPVLASETTFYFHETQELTFVYPPFQIGNIQVSAIEANQSSSSARVFSAADANAPTTSGRAITVSALISVSGQQSGYAAFVAWVTSPFPATLTLDGNVTMHIWMGSNDSVGFLQGSEFFMGIADYSPSGSGSSQFQLLDDYMSNAGFGNVFTKSPTEYVETLSISQHQFAQGDMIMFFAGAGSNKQGYSFTVYFDNPSWPSHADIPADPNLTVSEFPNAILIATAALLLVFTRFRIRPQRQNLCTAYSNSFSVTKRGVDSSILEAGSTHQEQAHEE